MKELKEYNHKTKKREPIELKSMLNSLKIHEPAELIKLLNRPKLSKIPDAYIFPKSTRPIKPPELTEPPKLIHDLRKNDIKIINIHKELKKGYHAEALRGLMSSNNLLTTTGIQNAINGGAYAILSASNPSFRTYKADDIRNIAAYAAEISRQYPTKNPPTNYGGFLNDKLDKDKFIEIAPDTFLIKTGSITIDAINTMRTVQGPIQMPISPPPKPLLALPPIIPIIPTGPTITPIIPTGPTITPITPTPAIPIPTPAPTTPIKQTPPPTFAERRQTITTQQKKLTIDSEAAFKAYDAKQTATDKLKTSGPNNANKIKAKERSRTEANNLKSAHQAIQKQINKLNEDMKKLTKEEADATTPAPPTTPTTPTTPPPPTPTTPPPPTPTTPTLNPLLISSLSSDSQQLTAGELAAMNGKKMMANAAAFATASLNPLHTSELQMKIEAENNLNILEEDIQNKKSVSLDTATEEMEKFNLIKRIADLDAILNP